MAPSDKASIIIPTLNSGKTFEACLKSVIGQSYPHKEIIVMDGQSRDDTLAIVARYQASIAHSLSEPDHGIYDAMNKGAAAATGQWLYFLGGDDEFHDRDVLQSIFAKDVSDCDMIYGDVWWKQARYAGAFDAYTITRKNICHQAIFLRRDVFNRMGGFTLDYPLLADYELNIRLFGDASVRKRYVDMIIANFAEQGSSSRRDDKFESEKKALLRRHLGVPSLKHLLLGLRYRLLKKRSWRKAKGA